MSEPIREQPAPTVDPWLLSAVIKVTCANFDSVVVLSPNEYTALKNAGLANDRVACHKWAIDYLDRCKKKAGQ